MTTLPGKDDQRNDPERLACALAYEGARQCLMAAVTLGAMTLNEARAALGLGDLPARQEEGTTWG